MNDKKPSPPKKTTPDWASQLAGVAPVVEQVAFKPTAAAFQHTLAPAGPGAPRAVVKAKVRAGDDNPTNVLVRVPAVTLERLKALTVGSHTVSIVALADWALDYLEQTGQAIETNERN
ncbi:TPA: hypothetical protein ACKP7M_003167 [Stenotrophomonas maltophilia]